MRLETKHIISQPGLLKQPVQESGAGQRRASVCPSMPCPAHGTGGYTLSLVVAVTLYTFKQIAVHGRQVLEAQLPQRFSRLRRTARSVHPYLCLAVRAGANARATGGQTARTSAKRGETHPVWRETFHLCVGDASPVLEVIAVHSSSAAGAPVATQRPDVCPFFTCSYKVELLAQKTASKVLDPEVVQMSVGA